MNCKLITSALVGVLSMALTTASAGVINVVTDPGTDASVVLFFKAKGKDAQVRMSNDKNNDGKVLFRVRDQEEIQRIVVFSTNDGIFQSGDGKLESSASAPPLTDFEPFDLPLFRALDPAATVFSDTSIEAFLAGGSALLLGDTFTVVDGMVPGVVGILFRDASGVPSDPALRDALFATPGFIDSLPLFNGPVQVQTPVRVDVDRGQNVDEDEIVPEPSTFALFIVVGTLGLVVWRLRPVPRARAPEC